LFYEISHHLKGKKKRRDGILPNIYIYKKVDVRRGRASQNKILLTKVRNKNKKTKFYLFITT
jgi:hypothetical protein